MDEIAAILSLQDGVISRRQALAAGLRPHEIERLRRRREWTAVHPGVYVNHTGPLSWRQRAWAAVLACWPAALDGESSLRAHEGPGRRGRDTASISVLVSHGRRVNAPDGVTARRSRRFDEQVLWNLSPPRMSYDDTIIELADTAAPEIDVVAALADACGGRRTTAVRLRTRIDAIPRLHRRALLVAVLDDVAAGTCSVLEHRYLTHVERPHALPVGVRQDRVVRSDRPMMRDVVYRGPRASWTQVVELDGRLDHDGTAARDRDIERDLDAALEREHTARLGYGQVLQRPCTTAHKVGRLLNLRGWTGHAQRCPRCPPTSEWGGSDAP